MELIEAIKSRHSVRKYADKPIEVSKLATLRKAIEEANAESGLNTVSVAARVRRICFMGSFYYLMKCMGSQGSSPRPGAGFPPVAFSRKAMLFANARIVCRPSLSSAA